MNLYKQYKNQFISSIYLFEDEYIKTYGIIKKDSQFYKIYITKYNYMLQGEKLIEKLRGRGYISFEEAKEYHNISDVKEIKEENNNIKIKIKTIFKRRK